MVKQYKTLSKCGAYLLEQWRRGPVLARLESGICRAKVLLLDEKIGWMVKGDRSNEAHFEELYCKLQVAFGSSVPDKEAQEDVIRHLDMILDNLRRLSETRPSQIPILHPQNNDQILVQHGNLSVSYVGRECFEDLLESDSIIRFRRNDGWVDPKIGPLRKIQQNFSTPDRRRTYHRQSAF